VEHNSELLPCPFCGEIHSICIEMSTRAIINRQHKVGCLKCGAHFNMPVYRSCARKDLMERWNTRVNKIERGKL